MAFVLLTACVAAAPFPYGAVTPPATFALCGAAFIIGALTFASRSSTRLLGLARVPVCAIVAIALLGAVQQITLSIPTLRIWAPLSATVYSDANEILRLFHHAQTAPRISIAPSDTTATILLSLGYAVLFASAAILSATRTRRRVIIAVFLASSAIHLLYATATTAATDRVRGTFINPNHFAGYLEIALAFAFGVVLRELLLNRERGMGTRDVADRVEKRVIPLIGPVVLWGVVAAGIALTRSRGGIVAAILATIILIILAALHRGVRSGTFSTVAVPATLLILAAIIFAGFATGEEPLLRFLGSDPREIGSDQRVALWRASIRAWHQSPLLGSGLGTFRESFRRVQPASIEGLVEQAHNDFLQMLVTGGWVGAALVTIAFFSMLAILVQAWLRQKHREESAFALAGIGALISLMLHGLVEFNMSIPAIPATLAVMLGVSWAAARYESGPISPRAADPAR